MTFPPAGAEIERNEAGEVTGWDMPAEPWYCDVCGVDHSPAHLTCPADDYGDDDE